MPFHAITRTALFCSALAFAGCSGGGGAPSSLVPAAASTQPPARVPTTVLVALGDSITEGAYLTASQRYANLLAADFGATVYNLGVTGETSYAHPAFNAPDGTEIVPQGGVLADEVDHMPAACAAAGPSCTVTLYIGINDEVADTMPLNPVYGDPAGAYSSSMKAIIAGIRAAAPMARIAVATVPNLAIDRTNPTAPLGATPDNIARTKLVDSFKSTILALPNVTVVDLQCEPAMYALSNYPDPWNVHPNAAGHAVMAADFYKALTTSVPVSTCSFGVVP